MRKRLTLLTLAALAVCHVGYGQIGKRAKMAATRAAAKRVASFTNSRSFPSTFKYSMIGFGMGYVNYFGDLAPETSRTSTSFNQTTPSFSAFYGKRISPFLTVKVYAAYNYLAADDGKLDKTASISNSARYVRNLSFRNQVKEFGFILQGDILATNRGYMRRNFLNPYGFVGLNVFTNNPQALGPSGIANHPEWDGNWYDLQPLKTEGQGLKGGPKSYSTVQIGMPIGFGVRYRLVNNWDLAFEFGYRLTFTNYLDDVGRNFYNFGTTSDPLDPKVGKEALTPATSELQVYMANRSAEPKIAATGEDRTFTCFSSITQGPVEIKVADVLSGASTRPGVYTSADCQVARAAMIDYTPAPTDAGTTNYIPHVRGYDNGSSPRGGGGRDYYLVTGLHLSYILHDQTKSPRFR